MISTCSGRRGDGHCLSAGRRSARPTRIDWSTRRCRNAGGATWASVSTVAAGHRPPGSRFPDFPKGGSSAPSDIFLLHYAIGMPSATGQGDWSLQAIARVLARMPQRRRVPGHDFAEHHRAGAAVPATAMTGRKGQCEPVPGQPAGNAHLVRRAFTERLPQVHASAPVRYRPSWATHSGKGVAQTPRKSEAGSATQPSRGRGGVGGAGARI